MRKNIETVIRAFLSGKPATGDSKRTCHTDGRILYSYAMPIASRGAEGTIVAAESLSPSRTTTGQIRAVRYMVPGAVVVESTATIVAYASEHARGVDGPATEAVKVAKSFPPALVKSRRQIFGTSFCNHGHDVKTGRPVAHKCRTLPPSALRAEMRGDIDVANNILAGTFRAK